MDVKQRIATIKILDLMRLLPDFCHSIGLHDLSTFMDKTMSGKKTITVYKGGKGEAGR
ncbi:hypothetical protein [Bilifractor sp. HCP3S3_D3]|uniref:hypothetical protein n=1 Tax=Bilifractor sp. HCP3S3_D3 TaxID=3438907 RepID=UPI003F8C7358